MKPILEVQHISKEFLIGGEQQPYLSLREVVSNPFKKLRQPAKKIFKALDDVSFDIMPGESIGIIGRNGAGKSTLLKILSGITPPTSGRIICRGRIASLLEVGTGFHMELTGRENIYMNGSILGMRRAEISKHFDEIVDFSGVENFLDTPLKRYSSGMQLRLAFAVAAHLEPEILVIDEVLAVGDSEFQKKCMRKMKEVSQGEGRTVLFVSHNIAAIKQLCTKGLLLVKGASQFYGHIKDALEKYQFDEDHEYADRGIKEKKDVIINKWYLQDNGGEHKFFCYSRDLVKFKIEVLINKPQLKVEFGFVIRDEKGEIIYGCNSRDFGGDFFELQSGKYVFNMEVRLPIKAGPYIVDLAMASEGQTVDHWVSSKELKVLDDYNGVLDEKWLGILNEKFSFSYEKDN